MYCIDLVYTLSYSLTLADFFEANFMSQQSQSHHLFSMPPKQKDNSATSAVSGPKAKRSKSTPTFRTPQATASTAGLEATTTSEVNSTKNRVVTLRASASGRRGYRTQDLATSSNSNSASPAAEISDLHHIYQMNVIPFHTLLKRAICIPRQS